ncbi:MAG: histidinol-phosphate transaminase [Lachnospiraceae bacterium]|nr:histidinol-phosphate transaminase [Lachnospiraceae bacterium]
MHGGDIYSCKIKYDFSVNLNPCVQSEKIKNAVVNSSQVIDTYPDYSCNELYEKLSNVLGIERDCIVLTSGASEGIMAAVRAINPDTGVIFEPAFSGYERALKSFEISNICHISPQGEVSDGSEEYVAVHTNKSMFFIASPSNPEGIQFTKDELREIYDRVKASEGFLLLDECFINLSDDSSQSMVEEIIKTPTYYDNLIVLRSFTKTFRVPGIRLGYIVCSNREINRKILLSLPEWNISVPAIMTGIACIEEGIKYEADLVKRERKFVINELEQIGIKVCPSNSIYILFKGKPDLKEKLMSRGILIRDCSDYYGLSKGYFRVAIKSHNENLILINEIKEIYNQHK